MLIDKVIAVMSDAPPSRGFRAEDLRVCAPFVLSDRVQEQVQAIVARDGPRLLDMRVDYFLPYQSTWIETGGRTGIYWRGNDQAAKQGMVALYRIAPAGGIENKRLYYFFDFREVADPHPDLPIAPLDEAYKEGLTGRDQTSLWILASLAMINSPRVVDAVERDLSVLNARRSKNRKPPLLSYREVVLRPEARQTPAKHEGGAPSAGPGVALHTVRAHLRPAKGRLVRVRAYLRGEAQRGIVLKKYRVEPPDRK